MKKETWETIVVYSAIFQLVMLILNLSFFIHNKWPRYEWGETIVYTQSKELIWNGASKDATVFCLDKQEFFPARHEVYSFEDEGNLCYVKEKIRIN